CTGCKSCEVACKQEHGLGPGERRNRVLWLTAGNGLPSVDGGDGRDVASAALSATSLRERRPNLDFFTLACQHCERPACARACPVNPKAIEKDPLTGVVQVIEDRCVGCGECVIACPYGAMGYDAQDHHAVKCDLCVDRRAEGAQTTACASVCPTRAIRFGERETLLDSARHAGRQTLDTDSFLLGPATIYLDRIAQASNRASPEQSSRSLDLGSRLKPAVIDPPPSFDRRRTAYPYGAPRAERQPDRVEPGGCNLCFNCCTTQFHFHRDKLVKITGNEADPVLAGRVCPKSQLSLQLYGSEDRLTQPLKRVGERGENRFEPISWDQALDEIADRLKQIRDRHGPEAVGIFSGTRTGTLTNRGYIRLFSQAWGTPNVETTEPFCSSGKNMAYVMTQGVGGSGNSYTETDLGSAELYVYIGDNQAETRPVHFGMINDWRLQHGARMIVIDPRETVTASKADWYLPIRPGGDLALALAIAHHLFSHHLHDADFCEQWVIGYDRWRDYILEQGYSPQWAAPIADIPAASIERLAEEIAAADGCVIFGSRGINQHTNSVQANRALMFVAAITGNWGRKGGAYFNMSASMPIDANLPAARRAAIKRPKLRTSPVGWLDAMRIGKPYPLKALLACNNPMALWPSQEQTREGLSALELLVHIDLFANETSAYADYVLPAATGIEKGEVGRACEDRRVVWIDRMIDPPGEARPDGWIWIELGKRLGFDDVLKEEWKDPSRLWDEVLIQNEQMRGLTQKRLHSVPWRWVRFPVASEDAPEIETLYLEGTTAPGAPEGHRFPTPSGKLEFWTEKLEAGFAAHGLSALPQFYGERESLIDMAHLQFLDDDSSDAVVSPFSRSPTYAARARVVQPEESAPARKLREQGFELELVTGRPAAPHFHSWTHYAWQAQEMWPDLYAQIHPDTARGLGIADGEVVTVQTAHGEVQARAWVYPGIRRHAVFMPIGWGERQPFNPWRPVNFLTDASQRDPVSDQTNLKSLLCRVKRANVS
ncbi:MAG: molybdopterin-dependent oxidoreductase, partial [Gammaproteobacteria bacterium]|nr:molybdopterin-dependent oxidoreductase [Gammaproteobacteria bacterium]